MEPRKQESKQAVEARKEPTKRHFQIVMLEERIAPRGPCRGSCAHYAPGHNR